MRIRYCPFECQSYLSETSNDKELKEDHNDLEIITLKNCVKFDRIVVEIILAFKVKNVFLNLPPESYVLVEPQNRARVTMDLGFDELLIVPSEVYENDLKESQNILSLITTDHQE